MQIYLKMTSEIHNEIIIVMKFIKTFFNIFKLNVKNNNKLT